MKHFLISHLALGFSGKDSNRPISLNEIHNSEQTQECFFKRALKQHLERKLFDTNIILGRMYTTGLEPHVYLT